MDGRPSLRCRRGWASAQPRRLRSIAVTALPSALPWLSLHDRADERADRLVLAGAELLPGVGVGGDGVVDERLERRRCPSPRSPWPRRSPRRRRRRWRRARPAPVLACVAVSAPSTSSVVSAARSAAGTAGSAPCSAKASLTWTSARAGVATGGGHGEHVVVLAALDDDHRPPRCRPAHRWPRRGAARRAAGSIGSAARTASIHSARRARAARGRARGSSGSRRRPPSCAACGCGRRSRPSGGSPGAPRSPASMRSIWRRASYSMARPSERTRVDVLDLAAGAERRRRAGAR